MAMVTQKEISFLKKILIWITKIDYERKNGNFITLVLINIIQLSM